MPSSSTSTRTRKSRCLSSRPRTTFAADSADHRKHADADARCSAWRDLQAEWLYQQVPHSHQSCDPARRPAEHAPGRPELHRATGRSRSCNSCRQTARRRANRRHARRVSTQASFAVAPAQRHDLPQSQTIGSVAKRRRQRFRAALWRRDHPVAPIATFTKSVISPRPNRLLPSCHRMNRRMTRMTRILLLAASLGLAAFGCAGLRFHEERRQGRYQHDGQRHQAGDADAADVDADHRRHGRSRLERRRHRPAVRIGIARPIRRFA